MSFKKNAAKLDEIASAVLDQLYTRTIYPAPPVPEADLQATYLDLTAARVRAVQGGKLATAQKKEVEATLEEMLTLNAFYVNIHCGGSLSKLLSSGYEAVSDNTARVPLPTPEVVIATLGMSGELVLKTPAIRNAKGYQAKHALIDGQGTPGEWVQDEIFTRSRQIIVRGLTPGAMYAVSVRAIGGSTGSSGWSNRMSARCL